MINNWIQLQYSLQPKIALPHTETEETIEADKPETGIVFGYTYNARGRADGVNVCGRDGSIKRIDWTMLSTMKIESGS